VASPSWFCTVVQPPNFEKQSSTSGANRTHSTSGATISRRAHRCYPDTSTSGATISHRAHRVLSRHKHIGCYDQSSSTSGAIQTQAHRVLQSVIQHIGCYLDTSTSGATINFLGSATPEFTHRSFFSFLVLSISTKLNLRLVTASFFLEH